MPMDGPYAARGRSRNSDVHGLNVCQPLAARGRSRSSECPWIDHIIFQNYNVGACKLRSNSNQTTFKGYPHMTTSLYSLSVESYLQTLGALDRVMTKGATHYSDNGKNPDDILSLRMVDNMMNFKFQVLSVIGQSVGTIESLRSGVFSPPGKSDPTTYAELHAKVQAAHAELKAIEADDVNSMAGADVVFELGETKIPFVAEDFVLSFSLPNLYFHAATAYDLLRKEGVPLGKRDFLGSLKIKR